MSVRHSLYLPSLVGLMTLCTACGGHFGGAGASGAPGAPEQTAAECPLPVASVTNETNEAVDVFIDAMFGESRRVGAVPAWATAEFHIGASDGDALRFEWSDRESSRPKSELSQVRYRIRCP